MKCYCNVCDKEVTFEEWFNNNERCKECNEEKERG